MNNVTIDISQNLFKALKGIGAGLAAIGVAGSGVGIGVVVGGAVQAIGRNPDAQGSVLTNMILGIVFSEAIGIFALVIALIILFVL